MLLIISLYTLDFYLLQKSEEKPTQAALSSLYVINLADLLQPSKAGLPKLAREYQSCQVSWFSLNFFNKVKPSALIYP